MHLTLYRAIFDSCRYLPEPKGDFLSEILMFSDEKFRANSLFRSSYLISISRRVLAVGPYDQIVNKGMPSVGSSGVFHSHETFQSSGLHESLLYLSSI